MHLKNWSLLYPNGRTPQLSPAYDLLSTMPYIAGETLSLSLMKNRQMDRCTPALFMALAKKAQVPQHLVMQTVVETSEKTRGNWAYRKRDLPLDAALALRIESHMASIPL